MDRAGHPRDVERPGCPFSPPHSFVFQGGGSNSPCNGKLVAVCTIFRCSGRLQDHFRNGTLRNLVEKTGAMTSQGVLFYASELVGLLELQRSFAYDNWDRSSASAICILLGSYIVTSTQMTFSWITLATSLSVTSNLRSLPGRAGVQLASVPSPALMRFCNSRCVWLTKLQSCFWVGLMIQLSTPGASGRSYISCSSERRVRII